MKDYFDETKYILEAIFFRYKDASYRGHGIMTWQPDAGFHIEASVRRNGRAQPKKITFGGNTIETIPNILLRPQGCDRAIAFPFVPINPLDLFINKHLSAQCGRVLFFQHSQPFSQRKILRGSALYHLIKKPIFPDSLTTETCLAGHKIKSRVAREAIWYEDPKGLNLSGHMITDNEFQLNWVLSDNQWTKKDCWNWAEGAKYALSVLTGQAVAILQHESEFGPHKRMERRRRILAKSVFPFLLFPKEHLLSRSDFIELSKFFAIESKEVHICRKIFNQIVDASQQRTLEGAQLLLSTILEGVFRTIYNTQKTKKFPKKYMTKFMKDYFSPIWSSTCEKALKVFDKMRHSTAHPIWIITNSKLWSNEQYKRELDDMAFLAEFYGYMIKALAGYKGLEPNFIN